MPLTPISDWHESPTSIFIDIKMRGATVSSADVFTTDHFVKVNCPPYFYQADLFGEVDRFRSSAQIGQDAVRFILIKKQEGLWGRLTISGDYKVILERRQQSLDAVREFHDKMKLEAASKVAQIGRKGVEEQMKLEEAKRKIIEKRKEAELKAEQESIESWKSGLQHDIQNKRGSKHKNKLQSSNPTLERAPFKYAKTVNDEHCSQKSYCGKNEKLGPVEDPEMNVRDHDERNWESLGVEQLDICQSQKDLCSNWMPPQQNPSELRLPPPRNSSCVPVTFSAKALPVHLPARESRDAVRLKVHKPSSGDTTDISEREPLFLQDKGDKFYKVQNYQSAINAYTEALEKDLSLVLCYGNRAGCYLQIGQEQKCIIDCTQALLYLAQGIADLNDLEVKIPDQTCNPAHEDVPHVESICKSTYQENLKRFSLLEGLGLLTCIRGQACTDPTLIVTGADVGQWRAHFKYLVHVRRGTARYLLGNKPKALEDFSKALQVEPDNKDAQHILAVIENELATYTNLQNSVIVKAQV